MKGHKLLSVSAAVLVLFACSGQAFACSVCFGDPESDMAKGATAGVLVMVGIIGALLLGIAGLGLTWIQRGRRMAGHQSTVD